MSESVQAASAAPLMAELRSPVLVSGGCVIAHVAQVSELNAPWPIDPAVRLGPERTRRLDPLSQFSLLAVELARHHAGLDRPAPGHRHVDEGVSVGTAFGATTTSVRYARRLVKAGPAGTNPIDFPDSIDGAPAAHISLDISLCGPSLTFTDGPASSASALLFAARTVASGRANRMHVVIGDVLDPVFLEALAAGLSPVNYIAQAVCALVVERRGLREVPAHTTELFGYSHSSRFALSEPAPEQSALAEAPFSPTPICDPSGVLDLAGAWLGAVGPMGNLVGSWQHEPGRMQLFPNGSQGYYAGSGANACLLFANPHRPSGNA